MVSFTPSSGSGQWGAWELKYNATNDFLSATNVKALIGNNTFPTCLTSTNSKSTNIPTFSPANATAQYFAVNSSSTWRVGTIFATVNGAQVNIARMAAKGKDNTDEAEIYIEYWDTNTNNWENCERLTP